jgi:hypothetical protein
MVKGNIQLTLDIANIEVVEKFRQKGLFSAFIQVLLSLEYEAFYFESVQSDIVLKYCEKYGWTQSKNDPFSYYKLKGAQNEQ